MLRNVHVNKGDKGVKQLFDRVHKVLKPGGILVLDYYPVSELMTKDRRHHTALIKGQLGEISLKPEEYRDYLLQNGKFVRSGEATELVALGI